MLTVDGVAKTFTMHLQGGQRLAVLDGLSFVTHVRDNREWRDVTLMMVTTEGEHAQIVRALAEAMDGGAWAESPGPGHGATFHLELPAV